jgi:predicted homoserine dehydrogenase-like protein
VQIYDDLVSFQAEGREIKVGLVGAGFMGRGIVEVVEAAPGMRVAAAADADLQRAVSSLERVGGRTVRVVEKSSEARGIDLAEHRVAASDPSAITSLESIDMVIEATGRPEIGAEVAFQSIMHGKHVGMLNVETDVTVGRFLAGLASRAGVVYTVCAGDEPAAIKELCDFALGFGCEIIACGKGKNNPLDRSATPETLRQRADAMGLNPTMLTEFVDGTKTMVEMCCLANAAGLTIDRPGMHGPSCNLEQLAEVFAPRSQGGVLERTGVVDFVIGDLAPGVFAVVSHPGEIANATFQYLKIGKGPRYLLHRPYHLTNLEVPHTIGWAVLHGKPTLVPQFRQRTEVTAIAKRDLSPGESIDCMGGSTVYGGIETCSDASESGLVPLGLTEGARIVREIPAGRQLRYEDLELKETTLLQLRKLQDRAYADV